MLPQYWSIYSLSHKRLAGRNCCILRASQLLATDDQKYVWQRELTANRGNRLRRSKTRSSTLCVTFSAFIVNKGTELLQLSTLWREHVL